MYLQKTRLLFIHQGIQVVSAYEYISHISHCQGIAINARSVILSSDFNSSEGSTYRSDIPSYSHNLTWGIVRVLPKFFSTLDIPVLNGTLLRDLTCQNFLFYDAVQTTKQKPIITERQILIILFSLERNLCTNKPVQPLLYLNLTPDLPLSYCFSFWHLYNG